MQTSRRILVACLTVIALIPLAVSGQSTANGSATNSLSRTQSSVRKAAAPVSPGQPRSTQPSNAKSDALQQALRQKMNELNNAPAAPAKALAPAPIAPAAPAEPAKVPPPVVSTPPPISTPPPPKAVPATMAAVAVGQQAQATPPPPPDVVLPPTASASALEKARAALRQKMADLNAGTDSAITNTAPTAVTAIATNPPPERVVLVTGNPSGTVVTDPSRDATIKAAVLESQASKPTQPGLINEPGGPAPKAAAQFVPLNAPPLPISLTKDQRLQALLRQYQLDQISPEKYHDERAKILAEP